jgi:hypothetical protein
MARVLVACEFSGAVWSAFRALRHDVWSCDLLPAPRCNNTRHVAGDGDCCGHYIGDVRDLLSDGWDLMIAHPPCTYLSVSGMHRTARGLRDPQLTEDALAFVTTLMTAPVPRIAIENPVSVISTRIRKPDQIIQPWMFGDDASKRTCLWLTGLPLLQHDSRDYVHGRLVNGKPRWANQTDSGQNRLAPSVDRWAKRSATYPGIARAMAVQWGGAL